jgi:hypothetical protein
MIQAGIPNEDVCCVGLIPTVDNYLRRLPGRALLSVLQKQIDPRKRYPSSADADDGYLFRVNGAPPRPPGQLGRDVACGAVDNDCAGQYGICDEPVGRTRIYRPARIVRGKNL